MQLTFNQENNWKRLDFPKIVRRLEDRDFAGQFFDFTELRNQYFRLYRTIISLLQNLETSILTFTENFQTLQFSETDILDFIGQFLYFTEIRNQCFILYRTMFGLYITKNSIFQTLQKPETNILDFTEPRNQYLRVYRTQKPIFYTLYKLEINILDFTEQLQNLQNSETNILYFTKPFSDFTEPRNPYFRCYRTMLDFTEPQTNILTLQNPETNILDFKNTDRNAHSVPEVLQSH